MYLGNVVIWTMDTMTHRHAHTHLRCMHRIAWLNKRLGFKHLEKIHLFPKKNN
ncbi:hypothetical protein MtrunA17_Chr3g0107121 [Medicago truncatula]|uniref:Uncharacterized protein n=1 Tax=Medicago truncatula TaxID=3880 RepID=A0A396GY23_MEDTR|nr:hypothetical protein MtrunA17_Chr7g0237911 [Medicago truncatula]RHN67843.1 hypothetical protein MtrunA17_Chr3g0107121 [Medicago truncatula]